MSLRRFFVLTVIAWVWPGCRDDDAARSAPPPAPPAAARSEPATATVDLRRLGLDAELDAPAGAAVRRDLDAVEVLTPDRRFHLEIARGSADLVAQRGELEDNRLNRLEAVVLDEPATLMYQSAVAGRSEFHFVAIAMLDEVAYTCREAKGRPYDRAAIDRMLAACRSLRALPPLPADAAPPPAPAGAATDAGADAAGAAAAEPAPTAAASSANDAD